MFYFTQNFDKTTELEKINGIIKTLRTTVEDLTNKNISLVEDNGKISLQLERVSEIVLDFHQS